MKEILDKLDKLDTRLDGVEKILVKQEANIAEHIRRTDLLETLVADIQDEIKPIERHVVQVNAVLKFLGALAIVIGAIVGVMQIFKLI